MPEYITDIIICSFKSLWKFDKAYSMCSSHHDYRKKALLERILLKNFGITCTECSLVYKFCKNVAKKNNNNLVNNNKNLMSVKEHNV